MKLCFHWFLWLWFIGKTKCGLKSCIYPVHQPINFSESSPPSVDGQLLVLSAAQILVGNVGDMLEKFQKCWSIFPTTPKCPKDMWLSLMTFFIHKVYICHFYFLMHFLTPNSSLQEEHCACTKIKNTHSQVCFLAVKFIFIV